MRIFLCILFLSKHGFALSTFSKEEVVKDRVRSSLSAVSKSKKETTYMPDLSKELLFYKRKAKSLELMSRLQPSLPDIVDNSILFRLGDMIGGKLSFSILSTNMNSPMLIIPDTDSGLPIGAKFICSGSTKHKRVVASCSKLVLPDEIYELEAQVLSDDGSAGIRGDFYTGKEEYIAGMIISEASKGLLASQQTSLNTGTDGAVSHTPKNAMIQALLNSAGKTSDILRDEMQTKEPKVFVKSNTRVIIFINRMGDKL